MCGIEIGGCLTDDDDDDLHAQAIYSLSSGCCAVRVVEWTIQTHESHASSQHPPVILDLVDDDEMNDARKKGEKQILVAFPCIAALASATSPAWMIR